MALRFKTVHSDGIAQISYLIGDTDSGTAAVIDPRPDCDIYLKLARRYELAITHIFETHIHADFMSGARELAARAGSAKIHVSGEEGANYGFDAVKIHDGTRFRFGDTVLTARHTPGHTPEHLAYEVATHDAAFQPWGVFSGDALLVGSAGRPDLLENMRGPLTRDLFRTLREYFLTLADGVLVFPCHGAGSACGGNIGDRPVSTIGIERQTNPLLQITDFDAFENAIESDAPPEPHHYRRLKKLNADGPPVFGNWPVVPALTPDEFEAAMGEADTQILDSRQMLAYGGGHVPGTINIGDRPEMSVWAGDMLDAVKPLLVVLEDDYRLEWVVRLLFRTGFTQFRGYLIGGMDAWIEAAKPVDCIAQVTVHELRHAMPENTQVLDVRAPGEWTAGHIPGASHTYVAELRDGRSTGLDRAKPVAVYCSTGYRASIAASWLKKRGFEDVKNVAGSWAAWTAARYPIETPARESTEQQEAA